MCIAWYQYRIGTKIISVHWYGSQTVGRCHLRHAWYLALSSSCVILRPHTAIDGKISFPHLETLADGGRKQPGAVACVINNGWFPWMEEVNGRLLRKKRCEGEGEGRDDGHAHPVDYDKARPRRHTASTTHAVAVHCAVSIEERADVVLWEGIFGESSFSQLIAGNLLFHASHEGTEQQHDHHHLHLHLVSPQDYSTLVIDPG
ncbi:hypothetical protein GW17_00053515 [Ensete ventricosum]|nr:hypothetical protein GW17_00053515 [Ensete ventricosum]